MTTTLAPSQPAEQGTTVSGEPGRAGILTGGPTR